MYVAVYECNYSTIDLQTLIIWMLRWSELSNVHVLMQSLPSVSWLAHNKNSDFASLLLQQWALLNIWQTSYVKLTTDVIVHAMSTIISTTVYDRNYMYMYIYVTLPSSPLHFILELSFRAQPLSLLLVCFFWTCPLTITLATSTSRSHQSSSQMVKN